MSDYICEKCGHRPRGFEHLVHRANSVATAALHRERKTVKRGIGDALAYRELLKRYLKAVIERENVSLMRYMDLGTEDKAEIWRLCEELESEGVINLWRDCDAGAAEEYIDMRYIAARKETEKNLLAAINGTVLDKETK